MKDISCSIRSAWKQPAQFLLLLSVMVVLTACQSVNRLREAQDSFNAAAAVENRTRLASFYGDDLDRAKNLEAQLSRPSEDMLGDANQIRSGYAAALLSLKNLSDKDKSALKADRLWGAALTLQALTQWRLGLHREALDTAESAEKEAKDQLFPRDAATLLALPGLIKIDLAYDRILTMVPNQPTNSNILAEVRHRLVGLKGDPKDLSAVEDLKRARAKVGGSHPVNLYLIQSQLAAFRNYQMAHFKTYERNPDPSDPAKIEAQHNLYELEKLLTDMKAGTAGTGIVNRWKNNYSIVPTPRPQQK